MRTLQRLQFLALLGALAQVDAATPSLAFPGRDPLATSHAPGVELVARKGTRAYVPGDGTGDGTGGSQDTTSAKPDPAVEEKALKDCVAIWDAKTHITPAKWKEICQRQLKERGAQLTP